MLAGCATLAAAYAWVARPRWTRATLSFAAGVLVLLVTLLSPLELLGSTYLLSAHMVQHLLLTQVAAPLLLIGLPAGLAARAMRQPLFSRLEQFVCRPVVAWLVGVGTLWLWHAPALYNAALAQPLLFDRCNMDVFCWRRWYSGGRSLRHCRDRAWRRYQAFSTCSARAWRALYSAS